MRVTARRRRGLWWASLPAQQLLDVRICDLGLKLETTPLAARALRLHAELERAGFRLRPDVWLSTAWFSPVGVPGFALPFYLAHPRLAALERTHMFEVEGGTRASFARLMRHEAAHALDHAYPLHRRHQNVRVEPLRHDHAKGLAVVRGERPDVGGGVGREGACLALRL